MSSGVEKCQKKAWKNVVLQNQSARPLTHNSGKHSAPFPGLLPHSYSSLLLWGSLAPNSTQLIFHKINFDLESLFT